jgi:hypothetical protein
MSCTFALFVDTLAQTAEMSFERRFHQVTFAKAPAVTYPRDRLTLRAVSSRQLPFVQTTHIPSALYWV